jgi:tetratricopeptide (TPR) repeat protein
LGDYYAQIARREQEDTEVREYYDLAVHHYQQAIEFADNDTLQSNQGLNYFFALASVHQINQDVESTIDTLVSSLNYASRKNDIWRIHENLTQLYIQEEDYTNALVHAQGALASAPESEVERLQALISQLQNNP